MGEHHIEEIPVSSLLLNVENPRFDIVSSQHEAIHRMVEEQDDKLIKLARDIVEAGLNPSDLPIVIHEDKKSGLFVVLEGNRRILSLKLLSTPILLKNEPQKFKKEFKNLNKKFDDDPINSIECVVFDDKEDANRWIELKHTGENEGVGIVEWDAIQKARFKERRGKPSIPLQAIEFIKKVSDDENLKRKLNNISITNLERIITDPDIRNVIGIDIVNGNLKTDLVESEAKKGLLKITKDLAYKKIKVGDIYTKKDRMKYIESLKDHLPDKSKLATSSWTLSKYDEKKKPKPKKKKSRKKSTARDCLIPRDCIIDIDIKRINDIYLELKDLNVGKFPNAGSVIIRVFLELSIDRYIEVKKLKNVNENDKLSKKLQFVSKDLEKRNILSKNQLRSVKTQITKDGSLLSTGTLNAYVHNMDISPSPDDLKRTWDSIQRFMMTLWDETVGK